MKTGLAAALLLAVPCLALERVVVAIPGADGAVSLGVFDKRGRLVRALAEARPVGELNAGLDGLVFEWDGCGSDGREVPAGAYHVRGWFIPDSVKVAGEAYLFNDWVGEDGRPVFSAIVGVAPMEGAGFAVAGVRPSVEGLVVRDASGSDDGEPEVIWEGAWRWLCGNAESSALLDAHGRLCRAPLLAAHPKIFMEPREPVAGAAFQGAALAVLAGGSVSWFREDGGLLREVAAPSGSWIMGGSPEGLTVSDGRRLWAAEAEGFREWPNPEPARIWSLSQGPEGSVWIAGLRDAGGPPLVRQLAPDGEILRDLVLDADVHWASVVSDPDRLRIFVIAESPSRQRLLGLEAAGGSSKATAGVADWEIVVDRSIWKVGEFGYDSTGHPVADLATKAVPASVKIRLAPNPFEPGGGQITCELASSGDGLWLRSSDGLLLLRVADAHSARPPALARGARSPDSVKVLAMDRGVVAEYSVSGLRRIVPLDAGEIVLGARGL